MGGGTSAKPILHFLVREPIEIARRRDAAEAAGRAAGKRVVASAAATDAGADLQGPAETRLVPRGDRQLF